MPCLEDLRLMAYLHGGFPLVDEPYAAVAQALGTTSRTCCSGCSVCWMTATSPALARCSRSNAQAGNLCWPRCRPRKRNLTP